MGTSSELTKIFILHPHSGLYLHCQNPPSNTTNIVAVSRASSSVNRMLFICSTKTHHQDEKARHRYKEIYDKKIKKD